MLARPPRAALWGVLCLGHCAVGDYRAQSFINREDGQSRRGSCRVAGRIQQLRVGRGVATPTRSEQAGPKDTNARSRAVAFSETARHLLPAEGGPIKTIRIATLVLLALLALGCDDMLQHDHPEEPTPPDPRTGPPSWTDNTGPTQTWTRGTAISTFTVPPVDAGNPAPTYSASGLPSGLRFHPSARRITGTPTVAGTGIITVMATNTAGTATWTMAWTVTALPPEPEPEPEPEPDLGLNADREILLAAQYVLDEGGLGWDARTPVDEWVGIWVDGSPKRVAGLSLYRGLTGELSGEIPASLGGLSELKHLGLSGGLSGEIPASLGRLSKLEDLSLGGKRSEWRDSRIAGQPVGPLLPEPQIQRLGR